jgi:hypothetical protein
MFALLRYLRVSALPTALADVAGGMALAMLLVPGAGSGPLLWLVLASIGLYLGGMGLNDLLHVDKDRGLGKPRPLAMGQLSLSLGAFVTVALMAGGVTAAFLAGAGPAGALLALLIVSYNWLARRPRGTRAVIGVLNMAACRALHVLLPLAAAAAAVPVDFLQVLTRRPEGPLFVGSVFTYFVIVTGVSLLEDRGGKRGLGGMQWAVHAVVLALPLYVALRGMALDRPILELFAPFFIAAALLLGLNRRFDAARAEPTPAKLGAVVGAGIRGHCLLMAAFALLAAPAQPWWGLAALLCYPAALLMSRWVSPT